MRYYKLFTDGSYQSEDKIAAIGGYLLDPENNVVFEFSQQINDPLHYSFHESVALIHGLKKSLEHNVEHLQCFSDDASMRKLLNKEFLTDISSQANPFREEIFDLKKQFKAIVFNYLPRKENKKADKLAGKVLRIYKEELTPYRSRSHFIGQEHKFLNLPNLVCEEDFQDGLINVSTVSSVLAIEKEQKDIKDFIVVGISKDKETVDNIDDYNPITINISFFQVDELKQIQFCQLISSTSIIQKKLISVGLDVMADAFNKISSQHKDIGLIFDNENQALRKLEMLFRKRNILPLPDTPLTKKFLNAGKEFNRIVLHNDEEIINSFRQAVNIVLTQDKTESSKIINGRKL